MPYLIRQLISEHRDVTSEGKIGLANFSQIDSVNYGTLTEKIRGLFMT